MIDTLGDKLPRHTHLTPNHGWVNMCPQCGNGTNSEYIGSGAGTFTGSGCRECKLIWTVKRTKRGILKVTGKPYIPKEKTRTYEIVVTHQAHFIEAETAEEARKKLIINLKLDASTGEPYGIHVRHHYDDAECNEGIPI